MIHIVKVDPWAKRSPWTIVLPDGSTFGTYKTKKAAKPVADALLKGQIATFQRQKPIPILRYGQTVAGKKAA